MVAIGTPLYAPLDLQVIKTQVGKEGGNTAFVKLDGRKELVRSLHLRELPKVGKYKRGEVFAFTGNTGLSTGPHWHVDVSKNGNLELTNRSNFIDPEKFFDEIDRIEPKPEPKEEVPEVTITTTGGGPVVVEAPEFKEPVIIHSPGVIVEPPKVEEAEKAQKLVEIIKRIWHFLKDTAHTLVSRH